MVDDPVTIVIVDDAPDVRILVRTRLRMSGLFKVVGEGSDGAAAVSLAREHRPAVMLLDVSMPRTDGLEALPQVLAASPTTKVVLFSGFEEKGLVDKALELGASAFIEKSASIDELVRDLVAVAGPAHTDDDGEEASTALAGSAEAAVDRGGVLAEHLERFREVFEEAAIGMATMTLTGRVIRANRALATLTHRAADELVGVAYGDLTADGPDAVAAVLDEIRTRPVDVVQLEHGLARGPEEQTVQATFAPVRDSGGRPLYVFLQVQDVTAARAAAEELRRSEERFRLLVEAVEDYAIFMLDPGGHVISWNSGAQRSKGYKAEEIVGQHFRVFYPPEVQASGHPERELELALADGHYEEEGWRVRQDGSTFWANVLITAVFNADGEHIGFAKVTRDTSRRRALQQEREHALEALAEANRRLQDTADDQAQFLAVTAHELRTPVAVLAGSADTLSRSWHDLTDDERADLLGAMQGSTVRLRRLVADLLTASRLEASALEMRRDAVLVRDVLGDALATVRRTHPDAEILDLVPAGLAVTGDRDRLAQALDNLLGNAVRYGASPVRVTATAVGTEVQIRVGDQGSGVPEALQPRLFDRFATGGSKGGTGLGLFIVRELARAHGGDATYEPGPAGSPGGEFVLSIPRTFVAAGGPAVGRT